MKTLDEVIKAFECCENGEPDSNCKECSYIGIGFCCLERKNDVLHYLKEYRSKQDTIAEQLAELEQKNDHVCELAKTVCEEYDRLCNRLAEEYRNDALSWDELKASEGKPVWIEDNLEIPEDTTKYWAIMRRIEKAESDEYALLSDFYYEKSQYGKDWVAYRKERE